MLSMKLPAAVQGYIHRYDSTACIRCCYLARCMLSMKLPAVVQGYIDESSARDVLLAMDGAAIHSMSNGTIWGQWIQAIVQDY
jgi:hypothetical protein